MTEQEKVGEELGIRPNRNGVYLNPKQRFTHFQAIDIFERMLEWIRDESHPLSFYDSTSVGDKWSEVSWGMCAGSHLTPELMDKLYPLPTDHIWPVDFVINDRVAPLDLPGGVHCPLDMRSNDMERVGREKRPGTPDRMGCFYYCSIFQNRSLKGHKEITREQTVQLYELSIERMKRGTNK